MLAADITSAATNADPNVSTVKSAEVMAETSSRMPASTARTAKNPTISVNGRRNAATIGGRSAFSTPIKAAASSAPRKLLTWTPANSRPDTDTATAPASHDSANRSGRNRGGAGLHTTGWA
jgi:hypothetical protein